MLAISLPGREGSWEIIISGWSPFITHTVKFQYSSPSLIIVFLITGKHLNFPVSSFFFTFQDPWRRCESVILLIL